MHRLLIFIVLFAIIHSPLSASGQDSGARDGRIEQTAFAGTKGDKNLQAVVGRSDRINGLVFEMINGSIGSVGSVSLKQRQPTSAPDRRIVTGRPGYLLHGVKVDVKEKVNAIRLVFVRHNDDDTIARDDTYVSEWVGTPSGKGPVTLGCNGKLVAGLSTSTKDGVLTGFSLSLKTNVAVPSAQAGAAPRAGTAAPAADSEKFIAMMTEAGTIIESANDAASSQKAVEQIRSLAKRSQNIGMGKAPPKNAEALFDRIDIKLQSLRKTLPEECRALQGALRGLMDSAATPAERNAATGRDNRVLGGSKLKLIVVALMEHAGDGNPAPASLEELVRLRLIQADVLDSPLGSAVGGDIAYIRPAGNSKETVLLYDAAALLVGEGTNVAFVDGSVRWQDIDQLRALNIPRPDARRSGGQPAQAGGPANPPQTSVELAPAPVRPANELLTPLLPYLVPTDEKKPTAHAYTFAMIEAVLALGSAGEIESARWLLESVKLYSDEYELAGQLSVQMKGGPEGADARAMFAKLKISLNQMGTLEGVSLGYTRAGEIDKAIANTTRFDGGKHLRKRMLEMLPSKELFDFYQAKTEKKAPADDTDLKTQAWAYAALGRDADLAKTVADHASLIQNKSQGERSDFYKRGELNIIVVRGLVYRGDIAGAIKESDALFDAIQETKDKAKDPRIVNASAWSNRKEEYAIIIARLAADGNLTQVKALIERHGNGLQSLQDQKSALAYLYAVANDPTQAEANLPDAKDAERHSMALGMLAHARAVAKDTGQAAAYIKRVEQMASTERTFVGRAQIASAALKGLLLGPEALAFNRLNPYALRPRPTAQR